MIAVLKDSAKKGEKGQVFLQFEKQIREAVYDAEDTLDSCLTQKSGKGTGILNRKSIDLAKKVKELRVNQLEPLFNRATQALTALPSQPASGATPGASGDKLRKIQLLREDNVVGFADQEATLIKYLNEETEQLDVISVVGMPGLGKTTLAWKIYRNQQIQFDFPVLIWVYVSQDFNMREVFLTILKKFTDRDMSNLDDQDLTRQVRSCLEKGRFLLFMDDVWTIEDWTVINSVLPKNNKLGKVLITSRHAGVAAQANCNREPHQLRFLNFDESWELLQLEVFGRNNGCPQELEGLGKKIADQCGGVPLAVVVIGGILVEKCIDRTDLWNKVSDSVSTYLRDDNQKRTENIISLSYNKLPYELRDCFLYIGVFPEDTEIPAWKLMRLWIAEGFIQESQWRSLEEVAEDNLNDLVARNLVMVEKTKANGDVKTCRVHDMIREFCQNEAAFANKNLFQEVKKTRVGVFHPDIPDIEQRRRLCIHSNVTDFLQRKPKGPKVRSFLCFSKDTINLPPEYTPLIPESFNLLRVIDANPIKFTRFPPKLTKLIHLRYLTLSVNDFKALPEGVSSLWNLQTVKIQTTSREFEIRADIGKMKQLRHLKTKAAIVIKEVKGEDGEKLQTLSRLSAKCCTKEVLNRASNLKNLGIRGNLAIIENASCLAKLERLEKLKLVHDTFPDQAAEMALSRLPLTHNFPPKLRILTLSSTYLDWGEMATLGTLRHLAVLKLKEMAFKGSLWKCESRGFPCLESLHITRTDLKIWTASDDPFPKLKNLVLKNCEKLQKIPSLLGKTLQLVEIERVTSSLVQSAREIEAEKQQMQGQVGGRRGGFKLKISPGDALPNTSSTSN
ncbi:hypothetical protein C2S51_029892 [Perilla frutescens var. frutescens]|nr:hypothetical protein C2S51_029892 [Perilla frutescens var. frutescens]